MEEQKIENTQDVAQEILVTPPTVAHLIDDLEEENKILQSRFRPWHAVVVATIVAFLFGYLVMPAIANAVSGPAPSPKEEQLKAENAQLWVQVKAIKAKEDADEKMGTYVLNMIAKTRNHAKFSDAKKQIVARSVVRVSDEIFDTVEHRHAWVAVLAIESEFDRTAKSLGTIVGVGQTTRAAFHEGLESCGLPKADDTDATELDLGLYASACYYKSLLIQNNNDPYAAIVAYNQGMSSKSLKTYTSSGNMDNVEALKYVSRFTYLTRSVTDKKEPIVSVKAKAPEVVKGPVVNLKAKAIPHHKAHHKKR